MPIKVEIQGQGKVAEFPDGTDQSIIDSVVKRDFFSPSQNELISKEHPSLRSQLIAPKTMGENFEFMAQPEEALKTAISSLPLQLPKFLQFLRMARTARQAKEVERLRPITSDILKTIPITMEEATQVARPAMVVRPLTEVAKETLQVKPPLPVSKTPPEELLELASKSQRVTPPPTPRALMSAEEMLVEKEVEKRILEWVRLNPDTPLARIAQGWLGKGKPLPPLTRKTIEEKMVGVAPKESPIPIQPTPTTQPLPPTKIETPPPIASPAQPTPPVQAALPTTLTQNEWRFLKGDISDLPPTGRSFTQKAKEVVKGGLMEFSSPYEVFAREPTGTGWVVWKISEKTERQANLFLQNHYNAFRKAVKFGPNSLESNLTGELLDKFTTWNDVLKGTPPEVQKYLTKDVKKAFEHMRLNWDTLWDDLVQRGLMDSKRKVSSYLFRMFDKDTIYQAWKSELDELVKTGANPAKVQRLQNAIDTFDKTGTMLYDVLPTHLNTPFMKFRTGGLGYSIDSVKAYNAWLQYYAKKVYKEPVLKLGSDAMQGMAPEFKQYTKRYLQRYADLDKDWALAPLEQALTSLEHLKDLGFWNTRSAFTNATQHLNTIVELGPKGPIYMARALKLASSPEGKALWAASGHSTEISQLRWGFMEQHVEKALKLSFKLFDTIESGNRKMAFFAGYLKGVDRGLTGDALLSFADGVLRKTQFLYGKVGSPLAMNRPGGKVGLQFATFSIKQLELMTNWAKKEPAKLASYILTASGIQTGLKSLGVDISNALGFGVNYGELLEAMKQLGSGVVSGVEEGSLEAFKQKGGRAGWIHMKSGLPKIPFLPFEGTGSGILPSDLAPSIQTIENLLDQKYGSLLPPQVERLMTMGRALSEGPIKEKRQGQPPKEGYPIRAPFEKTLRHVETLPQLMTRTFLARPTVETEANLEYVREKMIRESRVVMMERIADLILQGRYKEANELSKRYGRPTPQMIEAVRRRETESAEERRRRSRPPGGVQEQYKKSINLTKTPMVRPPSEVTQFERSGQSKMMEE